MLRLQIAEETAARQAAQLVLEERKRKEMEIGKKSLEKEVKREHELLQQNIKTSSNTKRLEGVGSQTTIKNIDAEGNGEFEEDKWLM